MALLPGETRTPETTEDRYGRPVIVFVSPNDAPTALEFPDVTGPKDADGRKIWAATGLTITGGGGGGGGTPTPTEGLVSPQAVYAAHLGTLVVDTGDVPLPLAESATLLTFFAKVDVAPVGADIIVDININGSTTMPGTKLVIPAGQTDSNVVVPAVTAIPDMGEVTFDIDQVGTSVAGSDLVIQIRYIEDGIAVGGGGGGGGTPTPTGTFIGHNAVGADATWPTSGNNIFAVDATVLEAGSINSLEAHFVTPGPTIGGPQHCRPVIFSGSIATPGAVIAVGNDRTIDSSMGTGWQTFTFPSGANVVPGPVVLAVQFDVGTFSYNQVAYFSRDITSPAVGGRYGADSYIDGPASPLSVGTIQWTPSIRATVTPSVGLQGITIQSNGVVVGTEDHIDTINFPSNATVTAAGSTVNVTPAGTLPDNNRILVGDSTLTPAYRQEIPADNETVLEAGFAIEAGAEYIGPTVDCTGGADVLYRLQADQNVSAGGLVAQELADDGVTWYAITYLPATNVGTVASGKYGGAVAAPSVRKVRLKFTQGATPSTYTEVVRAVKR